MEGENSTDKWAMMAPWCSILRGRLRLQSGVQYMQRIPSNDKSWILHVSLDAPENGQAAAAMKTLREALELLSLIAVIDNTAWRCLLAECITVVEQEGDRLVPADEFFLPKFLFRLDERDGDFRWLAQLLELFLVAAEKLPTSSAFQKTRAQIFALHQEVNIDSCEPCVAQTTRVLPCLQLLFGLELLPTNVDEDALVAGMETVFHTVQTLPQLAEARHLRPGDQSLQAAFVLDSQAIFAGAVPITPKLARTLISSTEERSALTAASDMSGANWTLSLNVDLQLPMPFAGYLFESVICGCLYSEPRVTRCRAIDTLSSMFDTTDNWTFACVLSALTHARGTQMATLDAVFHALDTRQTQRWKWQWLAYALFSGAVDSSIEKMVMDDVKICLADIDAIDAALQWQQPEFSANQTVIPSTHVRFVHLRRNTLVWMMSSDESDQVKKHTMFTLQRDGSFQVLNDVDSSTSRLSIIVPGYGRCSVLRTSVVRVEHRDLRGQLSRGHAVSSLSLSFENSIEEAVLPHLLELIGGPLKFLSIGEVRHYPVDLEWLPRTCPQLIHLRLASVRVDLDSIVRAFQHSSCCLRYLELYDCSVSSEAMVRFARALGDPHSNIARRLDEVCLHCREEPTGGGLHEVTALEVLAMLQTNKHLRYLHVWLPRNIRSKHGRFFRSHSGQLLPVVKERLPIAAKIAFLSCVQSPKHAHMAISRLDAHVCSLIFGLAATCDVRTVVL